MPNLLQKAIPVNIRQFLSHLTGDRSPLTEKDLWPSDIEAIRKAAQKNMDAENAGAYVYDPGYLGYGDYRGGSEPNYSFGASGDLSYADVLKKSYTDPAFRMETTLGQAKYDTDKAGNVIVTDRYNFNAPREAFTKSSTLDRVGVLLNALTGGNPLAAGNALGNIFGDADFKPGNPVRINVGPITNYSTHPKTSPSVKQPEHLQRLTSQLTGRR